MSYTAVVLFGRPCIGGIGSSRLLRKWLEDRLCHIVDFRLERNMISILESFSRCVVLHLWSFL